MTTKVLITGVAGFIGSFLAARLLTNDVYCVTGVDNLNAYYDPRLKKHRLEILSNGPGAERFRFIEGDICDYKSLNHLFARHEFDIVVNLAAQAGVRYSIENPASYIESNIVGFFNVLEACRAYPVRHLIYASSSSVYGANCKVPFSEVDRVDDPVSLYAATKKSNELMAVAYSRLYGIPATGLRFFTVYGPMGRPDMAYFGFADSLRKGLRIKVFNEGDCWRDFTYIDDVVEGVMRLLELPPPSLARDSKIVGPAHRVLNVGNSHPENLLEFIKLLCKSLTSAGVLSDDFDLRRYMDLVPMQQGDVETTYADTSALEELTGFTPSTPLSVGLDSFAKWYARYYGVS